MKKRTLLIALLVIVAGGGLYAWREYQRKPAGAAEMKADEHVDAEAFFKAFSEDEAAADLRFRNKVVQVSGKVRSADKDQYGKINVVLETGDPLAGVICEFDGTANVNYAPGDPATIKGFYQGFNLDILLQRCAIAVE